MKDLKRIGSLSANVTCERNVFNFNLRDLGKLLKFGVDWGVAKTHFGGLSKVSFLYADFMLQLNKVN